MSEQNQKIAVIGAGIIGVCLAIELRQKGFVVDLIDKDSIATQCCSIGNTGHIGSDIFPIAQPSLIRSLPKFIFDPHSPIRLPIQTMFQQMPWLIGFIRSAYGKTYQQSTQAMQYLASRCIDDTLDLYQKVGIEQKIKKTGCLFLYRNAKEFNPALKQWKYKEKIGIDYQVYQAKELLKFEPAIKKNQFQYGVFSSYWAKVTDPKEILEDLFAYSKKIGINFIEDQLTDIRFDKNTCHAKLVLKKNQQPKQQFQKVILASGIGSKTIAKKIGEKLPIAAARGYAITYSNPNLTLNQSILIRPMGLSVSSLNSGFRFGGLVELTEPNHPINQKIYHQLEQLSKQFFNISSQSITHWMNSRPASFDSAPILSQSQKHPNLYFSTAHSHWGLSFAASSAKILTELVTDENKTVAAKYQLFSNQRF